MVNTLEVLAKDLQIKLAPIELRTSIFADELTIYLAADALLPAVQLLYQEPYSFTMLIDLCGVDYLHYGISEWESKNATNTGFGRAVKSKNLPLPSQARFAVVYHLLSIKYNQRIRLHCDLAQDPPQIISLTKIWLNADWYEREAFDLFGILFHGHVDLRRILMDYGFTGHPLRKDFPLTGEIEMRYDTKEQRVVYEAAKLEEHVSVPKVIY